MNTDDLSEGYFSIDIGPHFFLTFSSITQVITQDHPMNDFNLMQQLT